MTNKEQINMENSKSTGLTSKVASKEILDKNKAVFEFLDRHTKTVSVIERTSAALGKKVVYKSTSGSSISGNLYLNAIGTTH